MKGGSITLFLRPRHEPCYPNRQRQSLHHRMQRSISDKDDLPEQKCTPQYRHPKASRTQSFNSINQSKKQTRPHGRTYATSVIITPADNPVTTYIQTSYTLMMTLQDMETFTPLDIPYS